MIQKQFESEYVSEKCCIITKAHRMVGSLSDGEDVGRDFIPPLSTIEIDGPHGVDWEPFVRIDGDTEQSGVGLNCKHSLVFF